MSKRRKGAKQASGQSDVQLRSKDAVTGARSNNTLLRRDIVGNSKTPKATVAYGFSEEKALKSRGVSYFIRYEIMPRLKSEVLRVMAGQLLNTIEGSDEMREKWFFEKKYKLDLTSGLGVFDMDGRVNALMFNLQNYHRRSTEFICAMATAISYLTLRGAFEFGNRISTKLKWTGLNTVFTHIGPIPYNSKMLQMIIDRVQLMSMTSPDGSVCAVLPSFLDYGVTDPALNAPYFLNDMCKSVVTGSNSFTRDGSLSQVMQRGIVPIMDGLTSVNTLGRPGSMASPEQSLTNVYWDYNDTQPTNVMLAGIYESWFNGAQNDGMIIGALYDYIIKSRDILRREYSDTILDTSSQQYRLYKGDVGYLDCMVTIDELANKIRALPIGDGDAFAQRYLRYQSIPLPPTVPSKRLADMYAGITDRFIMSNGRVGVEEKLEKRPESFLRNEYSRARQFIDEIHATIPVTDRHGIVPLTDAILDAMSRADLDRPVLMTDDPEQLNRLRSFTSTIRGDLTVALSGGTEPTLFETFTQIDFDWSKWYIVGYDPTCGEDHFVTGENLLNSGVHGKNSIAFEKGFTPAWTTIPGTNFTIPSTYYPSVGVYQLVMCFLRCLSSSVVVFDESAEAAEEYFTRATGEVASPYLLAEEIDSGFVAFRCYQDPRVDNTSVFASGYYRIVSKERVTDSTPNRQSDDWAYYAAHGRKNTNALGSTDSLAFDYFLSPFIDKFTFLRDQILDGLLFVGDAAKLSVIRHFTRTEISPIIFRLKVLTGNPVRMVGCDYPVKPYTYGKRDTPSVPLKALGRIGIAFDSMLTLPTGYVGNSRTIITIPARVVTTGINAPLLGVSGWTNSTDVAHQRGWMDFLPKLVWDTSRPNPYTIDDVLFWLIDNGVKAIEATEYSTLLEEATHTSSLPAVQITASELRVFKLAPEQSKVAIPAIIDGKPRVGFNHGDKSHGIKHYRAFTSTKPEGMSKQWSVKDPKGKSFESKTVPSADTIDSGEVKDSSSKVNTSMDKVPFTVKASKEKDATS